MTIPLLRVENLNQKIRQQSVLKDISFSIAQGELVGVIGPNGVGKSTLLKTLLHFTPAHSGNVLLQGDDVAGLSHSERALRISYLAQHASESFSYRVSDLIKMGAYNRKVLNPDQQAESIMNELGIDSLKHRLINELSGGERQLVHFARMLMQDAQLLLLDEPTAALDIGHEAEILGHLSRFTHGQNKSALLAIHNLNSAAEFCDRLLVLNEGQLIADGPPSSVLTSYLIQLLYGDKAVVGRHPQTGSTTVLPLRKRRAQGNLKVHVIGGAGSAVLPSKWLVEAGVYVTGGVAHQQDSDTLFWAQQNISYTAVPAFSDITDSAFELAQRHVEAADWVVLCNFPIGRGNARNLELAALAKRLVVVTDTSENLDDLEKSIVELIQLFAGKTDIVPLAKFTDFIAQDFQETQ